MLDRAYSSLPEKVLKTERFEIPLADSFTQGSKTILRNFGFLAQTLRRKPEELSKYLSKELAVPVDVSGNSLVLNARFRDQVLNERIKNFVDSLVLCKECKKPDTKLIDSGRGVKILVCEACGARSPVRL